MQGRLGIDEGEAKKCNSHQYGKKFKSYRLGYVAGKRDRRTKGVEKLAENPFKIPPDIWKLLQKRARWQMGYDMGWQMESDKKLKKKRK